MYGFSLAHKGISHLVSCSLYFKEELENVNDSQGVKPMMCFHLQHIGKNFYLSSLSQMKM